MNRQDLPASSAVRYAMAASAAMIAFQVAGRATRDALFLSSFPITDLPRMVAAAAALSLVLAVILSRALAREGPARLVPALFGVSTVLLLLEAVLLRTSRQAGAVVVFLHFNGLGALLVSGFWSLVNERFDPRTARQFIGRIGAAGIAGGVAGGLLAERVAVMFDLTAMLPVLAALHFACALMAIGASAGTPAVRQGAPASRFSAPLAIIGRERFLRALVSVVILATLGEGLLDYVLKASARDTFGSGDQLLRFFALFYTVVNLASAVFQTTLTRGTIQRLGLARTTGLLSWGVAIGGAGALAVPGLASAALAKGCEGVLRNSLYRSGYELLFTPLSARDKRSVKALIDVGAVRVGDLCAAWLVQLALLSGGGHATSVMLVLAIACAVAGIVMVDRVHAGYVATLERNLLSREVQLDLDEVQDPHTRYTVEHTISALPALRPSGAVAGAADTPAAPVERRGLGDPVLTRLAALRSRDAVRCREALAGKPLEGELVSQAVSLLAWDDVTREAADALGAVAPRHAGQLADALLDPDTDFAIRRRLPSVLAKASSERALEGLLQGLDDSRFEVRYRCGLALVRLRERAPALTVEPSRAHAAVLREVAVDRRIWEGQRLLEGTDDDPLELGAALRARASRSLEHVFTVLSLVMPPRPLKLAFRALYSTDQHLRGTALEYLETSLPALVREKLWPFIDQRPLNPPSTRAREEIVADLMASSDAIARDLEALQRRHSGS